MSKDGSDLERPMNPEAVVNRLFDFGHNERLKLASRGIDAEGRLWGKGTFLDGDDKPTDIAGFLASVDSRETQELGVMVFGWVITEVNGRELKEPKYLLSDVAGIDIDDRRRILSKATYTEAMRRLAKKCSRGNLQIVPEMKICHYQAGLDKP